jgi:hypothetical protein
MGAAVTTPEQQQQHQQQQQQQLEVERAMSGCLGLCGDWLAGSIDGSTAAAAAETPASPTLQQQQQQQQLQRLPPTHVFSVSCGVCPAIYWCVCAGSCCWHLHSVAHMCAVLLVNALPALIGDVIMTVNAVQGSSLFFLSVRTKCRAARLQVCSTTASSTLLTKVELMVNVSVC